MSNTRAWRAKPRTQTPNARQKRNALFLEQHPDCDRCGERAVHAHHKLPQGHPSRNLPEHMRPLCEPCHVEIHRNPRWSMPIVHKHAAQQAQQRPKLCWACEARNACCLASMGSTLATWSELASAWTPFAQCRMSRASGVSAFSGVFFRAS